MFKPNIQQMTTAIRICNRVVVDINGAPDYSYVPQDEISFCNWKGKGGTESTESGALVVYDTAELTMWYQDNISEQDQVWLNDNSDMEYEITNIEDVEKRNMFLIVKVKRVVST